MTAVALITGAGSGIGRALALNLLKQGITILAVGRRQAPLDNLREQAPTQVIALSADVATEAGRQAIMDKIAESGNLKYVIHNAATIEPMGRLVDIDMTKWRQMQAINVDAPIALTQLCLPYFKKGGRILQISSGAIYSPNSQYAAYCITKAALNMAYQLFREECAPHGVSVGSVCPGIVDTAMTDEIAAPNWQQVFESSAQFNQLKQTNKMLPVQTVAAFLSWLLLDVEAEQFRHQEWDIYQSSHHKHWLGDLPMPIPDFIENN